MSAGKLIVIEGIDGAGKTTQVKKLGVRLAESRYGKEGVETFRQPSDGPIGKMIRSFLSGEADIDPQAVPLLFAADRLDAQAKFVWPALREGRHVVLDRYVLSNVAYQAAIVQQTKGIHEAWELAQWIGGMEQNTICPHLMIVLSLHVEEAARRRLVRDQKATLYEKNDLLHLVANKYADAKQWLRHAPWKTVHVDASGSVDETHERVWAEVEMVMREG